MSRRMWVVSGLLLTFLVFPCGLLARNMTVQTLLFLLVLFGFGLLRGWRALLAQFKLFMPLAVIILVLNLLAGVVMHHPMQSLLHGTGIALLMGNGFFLVALLLGSLRFSDILSLPLGETVRKSVLLIRILLARAEGVLPELELALELYPQAESETRIRRRFRRGMQLILALLLFVLEEAQLVGELMDNRWQHCRKESV